MTEEIVSKLENEAIEIIQGEGQRGKKGIIVKLLKVKDKE